MFVVTLATTLLTTNHILAAANVVLAAAALLTIRSSNRVAAAAEKQTEAANAMVLESIRPIVLNVPHSFRNEDTLDRDAGQEVQFRDDNNGGVTVSVPIRNIGPGPAFIREAVLMMGQETAIRAEPLHSVLPSGETTVLACLVGPEDPSLEPYAHDPNCLPWA